MEEKNPNETFEYHYSAEHQEEVRRIREKYVAREEDKMEQLRRLDAGVTRKGTVVSLIVGIFSSLVMGIGMCLCMVWGDVMLSFVAGVVIGLLGIVGVVMAYPIYSAITKRERRKMAPEILRLTDELMK